MTDKYGYQITGYDAHLHAWRYWRQITHDDARQAWSNLARRA